MQLISSSKKSIHPLERIFAVAGMLTCLALTAILFISIGAYQGLWPLPGLYFIEMAVLSLVCALLIFMDGGPSGQFILCAAVGIFIGFSILGALSVGFFYLPVAILFGVAAIFSDLRKKQHIAAHIGVCLIAGLVQVVFMLAVIRLFF